MLIDDFSVFDDDESAQVGYHEIVQHIDGTTVVGAVNEDSTFSIYFAGDLTPPELFASLVAADAAMSFQEGGCFGLAAQLHALDSTTGIAEIRCAETSDVLHVVATTTHGRLVDSLGIWSCGGLEEYWGQKAVECGYDDVELVFSDETIDDYTRYGTSATFELLAEHLGAH